MMTRLFHKWKTVRQLPTEFWDALGEVYDHYLMMEPSFHDGIHARAEGGDLNESFAVLQKWLYMAREAGWSRKHGKHALLDLFDE